ncbi:MAG: TPM domain-containing protein [Clostridiales bacterium]|nr:TPM domain-containing protein [Candidatus Blautia equi]
MLNAFHLSPKKISKVCTAFLTVFLMTALFSFSVQAGYYEEQNPDTGYWMVLDDQLDLLSELNDESLAVLKDEMRKVTQHGHAALVTVNNHSFSSEIEYAQDYYYKDFRSDSGTMLVIDFKLRKITVVSDGEVHKAVTNSYARSITDNIYSYASDGDYYRCALEAFQQINTLLAGKCIAQPMKYISNALLAVILALLINYIWARIASGSSAASDREWLEKLDVHFNLHNLKIRHTGTTKRYNPPSKSSGGSSGGGGGGGHSSGGGSHSF